MEGRVCSQPVVQIISLVNKLQLNCNRCHALPEVVNWCYFHTQVFHPARHKLLNLDTARMQDRIRLCWATQCLTGTKYTGCSLQNNDFICCSNLAPSNIVHFIFSVVLVQLRIALNQHSVLVLTKNAGGAKVSVDIDEDKVADLRSFNTTREPTFILGPTQRPVLKSDVFRMKCWNKFQWVPKIFHILCPLL